MAFLPHRAEAQQGNIDLDHLRTPVAPAFTLLDVAPTAIEQPLTPKELGLSLLSSSSQANLIPQNIALEVAPYWLAPRPNLSFDTYASPNLGQAIVQNTSLSFATIPITEAATGNAMGTSIGLGIRTLVIQGNLPSGFDDLVDSLEAVQGLILRADDKADEERYAEEAQEIALAIQEMSRLRRGFSLEAASAAAVRFPSDSFEDGSLSRFGVWLTPSYQGLGNLTQLQALGVARLIYEDVSTLVPEGTPLDKDSHSMLDLGGRLLFTTGAFSISGEGLWRKVLASPQDAGTGLDLYDDTFRASVLAEYEVNSAVKVYASFGRNYDAADAEVNTLIALVGINYGFGKQELPIR